MFYEQLRNIHFDEVGNTVNKKLENAEKLLKSDISMSNNKMTEEMN